MPSQSGNRRGSSRGRSSSNRGRPRGRGQGRGQASERAETPPSPLMPAMQSLSVDEERKNVGEYWQGLRDLVDQAIAQAYNGDDEELDSTTRAHFSAHEELYDRERDALKKAARRAKRAAKRAAEGAPEEESNEDDSDSESSEEDPDYTHNLQRFGVNVAARFMDAAGRAPINSRPSARLALLFLARADWNFRLALDNFEDALNAGDEEIVADAMAEEEREKQEREMEETRQHTEEVGVKKDVKTSKHKSEAEINEDVDRKPAVLGKPDDSKLSITLTRPGKGPKTFQSKETPNTMNWNSPQAIRALNKWRSQVLLRHLGPKQEARQRFLPSEIAWLTAHIRQLRATHIAAGNRTFGVSDIDIAAVTRAFNRQFQGRVLEGSDVARPTRTEPAIRSEMARIKDITDLTGMATKDQSGDQNGRGGRGGGSGRGNGRGKGHGRGK